MLSVKATILAGVSAAPIQDYDFEYQAIRDQFASMFDGEDFAEMEELLDDLWEHIFFWMEPEPVIEPEPAIEPEPIEPIVSIMPVEPEPSSTCQ